MSLGVKQIGEFQGLPTYRLLFHSCGNEAWHALTSDFVTTENPGPELIKTSLYYEGNTARNEAASIAAGQVVKTGHTRPWESMESNELAGHGESKLTRIVVVAPHPSLPVLKPPAEGELILQPVGSFAAKGRKGGNSLPQFQLRSGLATGARLLPRVPASFWLQVHLNCCYESYTHILE